MELHQIRKEYGSRLIWDNISVQLKAGDRIMITGPSGSGKSTLLHIMGLLDPHYQGHISFRGQCFNNLSKLERARLRSQEFSFVFQQGYLLPEYTALENVMLPLWYAGFNNESSRLKAMECLAQLNLEEYAHLKPNQLSGGQQQRVTVARAVVKRPSLLLADEPTASLDPVQAKIMKQWWRYCFEKSKTTIVLITHDLNWSDWATRHWHMDHQRLEIIH